MFSTGRNNVGLVWVLGILLTAFLYVTGPEHFLEGIWRLLDHLFDGLGAAIAALIDRGFDLIRALAVGLFVVFVILAVMAAQRGLPSKGALILLSLLYFVFLAPVLQGGVVSANRWFGAFVLAAIGAAIMTRRLTAPSLPPAPMWPRGPAG